MMSTAIMHQSALHDFGDLFLKVSLNHLLPKYRLAYTLWMTINILIVNVMMFYYFITEQH